MALRWGNRPAFIEQRSRPLDWSPRFRREARARKRHQPSG